MKYTVKINPGIVKEGCQSWWVEIDFYPGYESKSCKTRAEAELWIGDTIMNHADNYIAQHGDAMEVGR